MLKGDILMRQKTIIMTSEVYNEICNTIGAIKPEQGGILGSSDGTIIDNYYYDFNSKRTSFSYSMNVSVLNEVIHQWNDNDIRLMGVIHSHPEGFNIPSMGDVETASNIVRKIDVGGEFFIPIVQVSKFLNGELKIYPFTYDITHGVITQSFYIDYYGEYSKNKKQKEILEPEINNNELIDEIIKEETNLAKKKRSFLERWINRRMNEKIKNRTSDIVEGNNEIRHLDITI